MPGLAVTPELNDVQGAIATALEDVTRRFEEQLRSDLPPVQRLVAHIEHYRGKMLRPTLVLACGLASSAGSAPPSLRPSIPPSFSPSHITSAAVCEMIHMATLVHDDVLDEADIRRRGETVNRLHGNEAAVILGDYLLASAYHLCSQLDSQKIALLVAHISMTLCAGELLQLSHRNDLSLDETTYFEIVERKTASLIGLACRLGAQCSGADEESCTRFDRFGRRLGVAFQIQDDLLDLTAKASALGKPAGKDMEAGKLTLPMIHHLAAASPEQRAESLLLLELACGGGPRAPINGRPATAAAHPTPSDAASMLRAALQASGSIPHARKVAEGLVIEAKAEVGPIPDSASKSLLLAMADAVITRTF
jgi:octaprenyl-diphosphate synthase